MPKVIYHFNSALHRGQGTKSSDPYSLRRYLHLRYISLLVQTLGTNILKLRCGSTLSHGLFFGKKSPAKETSNNFELKVNLSSKFDYYINKNKSIRLLGFASLFALVILSALTISPIVIKSDVAEGTMGVAKASQTSLTISSTESADLNIMAASSTGTFASSADDDMGTFTVTTDNYTGYTLKIAGNDDDGLLTNADTSTNASINSLADATDEATFTSGSENTYNNKWGYQLNLLDTTATASAGKNVYTTLLDGKYQPAPTTSVADINTTGCANGDTAAGCPDSVDTYAIRLGARIDYTKPTGTYTNTFIITAVANDISYSISYADNTGDSTVTGSPINPASTTASTFAGGTVAEDSKAKLPTNIPTRDGYTFAGWCLGKTKHTASKNSECDGATFDASTASVPSYFGIDQTLDNRDITLYALWNVNSYDVQVNFAGSGVSSVVFSATGQTTQTISTSGNKASLVFGVQYAVTMNLSSTSYEPDSWALNNSSYGALSSTSTNPTYFTANALSGNAVITAKGKSAKTYIQDFTKTMCQNQAPSKSVTVYDKRDEKDYQVRYINGNCWMVQNLRYIGDGGSSSGSMVMKSATSNISTNKTITCADLTSGNSTDQARLHVATSNQVPSGATYTATDIGVWYNYVAASAGTITGSSNTTAASQDICPKGWRLPTNSENSGITSQVTAFSGVTGGYYYNGGINHAQNGYWWSTTSGNSTDRYFLAYNNGSSLSTSYGPRADGLYVRCIRSS